MPGLATCPVPCSVTYLRLNPIPVDCLPVKTPHSQSQVWKRERLSRWG